MPFAGRLLVHSGELWRCHGLGVASRQPKITLCQSVPLEVVDGFVLLVPPATAPWFVGGRRRSGTLVSRRMVSSDAKFSSPP